MVGLQGDTLKPLLLALAEFLPVFYEFIHN